MTKVLGRTLVAPGRPLGTGAGHGGAGVAYQRQPAHAGVRGGGVGCFIGEHGRDGYLPVRQ